MPESKNLIKKIKKDQMHDDKISFINFINLSLKEKKEILEIRNNHEIRKQMKNSQHIDYKNHIEFIDSLNNKNDTFYWAVYYKEELIGAVNFVKVNFIEKSGSFGSYVKPELIGLGFGFMIIYKLISFIYDDLNFEKLYGIVKDTNKRSLNMLLSFGFKVTGKDNEFLEIEMNKSQWIDRKAYLKKRIDILNKIMGANYEKRKY